MGSPFMWLANSFNLLALTPSTLYAGGLSMVPMSILAGLMRLKTSFNSLKSLVVSFKPLTTKTSRISSPSYSFANFIIPSIIFEIFIPSIGLSSFLNICSFAVSKDSFTLSILCKILMIFSSFMVELLLKIRSFWGSFKAFIPSATSFKWGYKVGSPFAVRVMYLTSWCKNTLYSSITSFGFGKLVELATTFAGASSQYRQSNTLLIFRT